MTRVRESNYGIANRPNLIRFSPECGEAPITPGETDILCFSQPINKQFGLSQNYQCMGPTADLGKSASFDDSPPISPHQHRANLS